MKKALISITLIIFLPIIIWLVLLFGFSHSTDESKNREYWGGYDLNETYILEKPIFIIHEFGNDFLVPAASVKRCLGRHKLAPTSIESFKSDPVKESILKFDGYEVKLSVKGILEEGTILKLTKLKKTNSWSLWFGDSEVVTPYATVLSGEYKGLVADITDISIYYRGGDTGPFLYKPERGVIRKKTENSNNESVSLACVH